MKYNFLFGKNVKVGYLYSDTKDLTKLNIRLDELYKYKHRQTVIPKMFIQLNSIEDLININNGILKLPTDIKNAQKELIVFLEFEDKYYDVKDIIESVTEFVVEDLFPFSINICSYDDCTINPDAIDDSQLSSLAFKTRNEFEFFKQFYNKVLLLDKYTKGNLNFIIEYKDTKFNTLKSFINYIESLPTSN